MARILSPKLKSLSGSVFSSSKSMASGLNYAYMNNMRAGDHIHARPIVGYKGHNNHTDTHCSMLSFEPRACAQLCKPNYGSTFSPTLSSYRVLSSFPLTSMSGFLSYSSFGGSKGDNKGLDVQEASGIGDASVSGGGDGTVGSSEWVDKLKDVWKSVVDAANITAQKAKEASDELTPYAQQVMDSHPYLKDVVVPVGGTFTAALLAWLVMPSILRKLHNYSNRGSAALLSGTGSIFAINVAYEKSVWGALEGPVRSLTTFMVISEICHLIAPDAVASQLIGQAWKGAVALSLVWFVQRWKTNLFARALASEKLQLLDRERLLTLDKISSVGLLAVGIMAIAEASGVAVQSIITVGGIGGVATAFAARDILGNVLSGLSIQFSKPFSLGDTIKAGSIEGQVVEMGLTTTSLLNVEKFPVIVPNSIFSNQVIVNKSRAGWRAFISKIPLQFRNMEKIPQVSADIKSMLDSYPKVFLGREAPYCYLPRIENSYAELTLGCNLQQLSKAERYSTEQDILLKCIQIIQQHGVSLGNTQQDLISQ
ncbi:mechanosensitive ion channel protein 1, mitochondrial-like [Chenopodium quinoa]|uniref:mechanosensitive ion channel protein 1, mitochondrial-like n=1 Tax=Chenopodium quinoa TaxID=63459 RepID=UPI000B77DE89|nr:mechanosensitive ion channel protein 1, mitochondrial-like [Chenopodium quinoa]XP_021767126.1 mechanosensitive ion channel protein 1, mitochondrial-like [Chenopodium quinoa]